ncbi:MAG: glycosyltransferase [Planctomycetota bacterium]|nr:glycosyltransferase [Planctomycetota bacterium]
MRIVQVIHGYPMRYNAGSEIYTQILCQGLADRHEVHVFTREENPLVPDYGLREERDIEDERVTLHVINLARSRERYNDLEVDRRFAGLLDRLRPDVVHIGHLNHLSTSLVPDAARQGIPVVFTLHDYWLMCPRGQFIQIQPENPSEAWALCDGQEDRKCAERCYARYASGVPEAQEEEIAYWTSWVERRMRQARETAEAADLFIAPSRYLHDRFRDEFGIPSSKLVHLPYGFDISRLGGRRRKENGPFTFGYIGSHTPAKGIHLLIKAFRNLSGEARLRIWGKGQERTTAALKSLAEESLNGASGVIEWRPEYRNREIARDVFEHVDAIVVPSIWMENAPLVIQEALQARVPVITADAGGMAELVHDEVNGLLFEIRNPDSLAMEMQRFVDDPGLARRLGERGYLPSPSGDLPDVRAHVEAIEGLYEKVIARRSSTHVRPLKGPWRITFDTNPDLCNLRCIMCEEHSPHSHRQTERRAAGKSPRVMPIELIGRIVSEGARQGLREVIPSTMGEPLLYEHFDEILALCREHGVKLNLTTNGTFPRLGAREWARRIVPVTSDVKISWNGATKETQERIMLGACWEKILDNVRTLIEVRNDHAAEGGNRCRVTLQITFLETNVAELADIVRLAIDLGVDRVKGHHLWAHFEAIKPLSMRRSPEAIRRWNESVFRARSAATERPLPNGKPILLENIFLLDEDAAEDLAPGGPCPFLGQEAWVSAEGRFDPCCAPDAQRRTLGEFGNLHDQDLAGIWNGDSYKRLLKTYRNRALCIGCNMRKPAGE